MASCLPDGVVVGRALRNVKGTDFCRVLTNNVFSFVTVHELPGVNRVDFDTFSHIVPIEAHPWDQQSIILISKSLVILRNSIITSGSLRCSISDLRPVVTQSLRNNWNQVATKFPKLNLMRTLFS